MSGRWIAVVLGISLAFVFTSVFASDPPHWTGARVTIDCTSNCHLPHNAPGGTLNQSASNVNLCQSCHNTGSTYAPDLAISNSDKAVPGVGGTSHAFDVLAVNPTYNTRVPVDNPEMAKRIYPPATGNIVCSTCHDQHAALKTTGATPRISAAQKVVDNGGTGIVTSGGTFTGDFGLWYLVEITQLGPNTLRYSKDNGSTWVSGVGFSYGVAANLDFGVTVTVTSGVVVGERWEFSASYPFLRGVLDSGDNSTGTKFCRDCHNSWTMTPAAVKTWDGSSKGHPVGMTYPTAQTGYYATGPLDGDGSSNDGNPTNDLKLQGGTNVQCLTCHGIHFADSNTQTVDGQ